MAWSLWRGCRARGRRFAGCVDGPVHWMGVGADVSLDASAGVLVRVALHVFGSGACLYAVAFRRGRRLGPVNFSFSPSASSSAHGIRGRLAVARMRRFMSSMICWRSAAYAFGGSGASSRTGSPLGPLGEWPAVHGAIRRAKGFARRRLRRFRQAGPVLGPPDNLHCFGTPWRTLLRLHRLRQSCGLVVVAAPTWERTGCCPTSEPSREQRKRIGELAAQKR